MFTTTLHNCSQLDSVNNFSLLLPPSLPPSLPLPPSFSLSFPSLPLFFPPTFPSLPSPSSPFSSPFPAFLPPAAFRGWIDRAYPPQPNSDKIELQVTNGSSAILECHPNTTEPVIPRPSWLRNNTYLDLTSTKNHYLLPDGSLLVRDLSFPPGSGEWQYKCIISLPTERTRDFVLSLNQGTSTETIQCPLPIIVWGKGGRGEGGKVLSY